PLPDAARAVDAARHGAAGGAHLGAPGAADAALPGRRPGMTAITRLLDPNRDFFPKLVLLALLAFGLRIAYELPLPSPGGDAVWYHLVANGVADGKGFVNPFLFTPTAAHPPL